MINETGDFVRKLNSHSFELVKRSLLSRNESNYQRGKRPSNDCSVKIHSR